MPALVHRSPLPVRVVLMLQALSARARRALRAAPPAAFLALSAACAVSPASGPAPAVAEVEPAAQVEQPIAPELAAATFDDVWTTVRDTHFDPTLNGVDWDAVRDELRPAAAAATTQPELRAVIGDMLERLGQSHFGLLPRSMLPPLDGDEAEVEAEDDGDLGFDVRSRGGAMLVTRVAPAGPAGAAGVRPGWILARLDGLDLGARIAEIEDVPDPRARRYASFTAYQLVASHMLGPIGSEVECVFEDAGGRSVELALQRKKREAVADNLGTTLPTFFLHFDSDILERDGKRIGTIHFTNWFLPMMEPINDAVDRMRGCDGIVLDLRGNTGGVAAMTMGVAGHFFEERTDFGSMTTQTGVMNFRALPQKVNAKNERVQPFTGPLAILIDDITGSASEVFAGGLQSIGRARVFGETSAGAVLPAVTEPLPNGDVLLHAIGDFKTATGELLEGVGVVPDVSVPLTRETLLADGDPVLEAAVDWITGPRTN